MGSGSISGSGWGKWGIVGLRFAILGALLFYLGAQLRGEEAELGATIGRFGTSFWVLFGVYLLLNIVYAIEAIEAFVSQRIAAGIARELAT